MEVLKAAEVDDRVRQAAQTIYQALIEAELTAVIGAASHHGSRHGRSTRPRWAVGACRLASCGTLGWPSPQAAAPESPARPRTPPRDLAHLGQALRRFGLCELGRQVCSGGRECLGGSQTRGPDRWVQAGERANDQGGCDAA